MRDQKKPVIPQLCFSAVSIRSSPNMENSIKSSKTWTERSGAKMSDNRLENVRQLVAIQKPDFEKLAKIHGAVNFLEEASFAMQALQDNDYLCKTAMAHQDSFKRTIL